MFILFFLHILPFISTSETILFGYNIQQIKQFYPELIVLYVLAASTESVAELLVYLPLLTAKFATFTLTRVGFDVSQQRVYMILPTGAIEVFGGCSSAVAILQLLRLALIVFRCISYKIKSKNMGKSFSPSSSHFTSVFN